ncbi:phosphopantetheine adenylyltransferase [Mannheimia granulomatis]|uniref:Phosphopantetheine adenylyltransferase n=1 Tax=Mannheimia granulomatis TaxID=85402 RepID=A0A011P9Q9_9PAST|nr:pantetheine-phosphate adenylyltransferase [Mannheimia granulomatis]EXI63044.1 phosphopantetheine adenylyltransferase [Mannheimia granulomatis]RGE48853.1 phosphopantetheine adenylyltransferase [Mannheimia granulomatis]
MSYKVIYAGTFDPITNGHLDVIRKASLLFSEVIVAVAENSSKQPLFSLDERVQLVKESCAELGNIEVIGFSGLLADFAKSHNAKALIRGIRGADDIDYEIQLAQLNQKLSGSLETIFFPPSVEWRYLSSTMVREIYRHHGDISQFVPQAVKNALNLTNKKLQN